MAISLGGVNVGQGAASGSFSGGTAFGTTLNQSFTDSLAPTFQSPYGNALALFKSTGDVGSYLNQTAANINYLNTWNNSGYINSGGVLTMNPRQPDQFGNPPPTDQPAYYANSIDQSEQDAGNFGQLGGFFGSNIRYYHNTAPSMSNAANITVSESISSGKANPPPNSIQNVDINASIDFALSEKIHTFGTPEFFRALGDTVYAPTATQYLDALNAAFKVTGYDWHTRGFEGLTAANSLAQTQRLQDLEDQQSFDSGYRPASGTRYDPMDLGYKLNQEVAFDTAAIATFGTGKPSLPELPGAYLWGSMQSPTGLLTYNIQPLYNSGVSPTYGPNERFFGDTSGSFVGPTFTLSEAPIANQGNFADYVNNQNANARAAAAMNTNYSSSAPQYPSLARPLGATTFNPAPFQNTPSYLRNRYNLY